MENNKGKPFNPSDRDKWNRLGVITSKLKVNLPYEEARRIIYDRVMPDALRGTWKAQEIEEHVHGKELVVPYPPRIDRLIDPPYMLTATESMDRMSNLFTNKEKEMETEVKVLVTDSHGSTLSKCNTMAQAEEYIIKKAAQSYVGSKYRVYTLSHEYTVPGGVEKVDLSKPAKKTRLKR